MSEQPLFSVLIANYNNGKYLQEAIYSVLAQTYSHWEIIIVDDKSTDDSYDIYHKYENDPRFHIYYNENNMGCGYTKHICAIHANGEYCGYLDPDDALLPNALEVSGNILSSDINISLAFSRFYFCDENLNIVKESRPLMLKDGESYFEHKDYKAEHFASFRRSKYMQMGGLDVTLRAGVDADLYYRLEEYGNVCVSHEITYKYRIFSDSITAAWDKALYWNIIARHNTCVRRGLRVEDFTLNEFTQYINNRSYEQGVEKCKQTRSYKVGYKLLQPIVWIKHTLMQLNIIHE